MSADGRRGLEAQVYVADSSWLASAEHQALHSSLEQAPTQQEDPQPAGRPPPRRERGSASLPGTGSAFLGVNMHFLPSLQQASRRSEAGTSSPVRPARATGA